MEFCVRVLDHMYSFVTILARQAMMWYHSVLTPYAHTCLCPVHTIEKIGEPKLSMCRKHIVPLNARVCTYYVQIIEVYIIEKIGEPKFSMRGKHKV